MGKTQASDMSDASLDTWVEWKRKCAAAKCQETAQHELHQFAAVRLQKYTQTEAYRTNDPDGHMLEVPPRDAWHLLETYFLVHSNREGVRYKDWVFGKVRTSDDAPENVIQGSATNLMREAVREFIRRECPKWHAISADTPLSDAAGAATVVSLLEAPAEPISEVERREYEELAEGHAGKLFAELDEREKIVLAVIALGRTLDDPRVEELAGRKKATLYTTRKGLLERIKAIIAKSYPDEDPECIMYLASQTLLALFNLVLKEKNTENSETLAFLSVSEDTTQ
jgi:hypothetical protein